MSHHQIEFIGQQSIGIPGQMLHGFDLPPALPVIFFFVLSGFVMMTAHGEDFGRLSRLPRFAWRRVCRIYPMYWLSLSVWLYFLWPTLQAPHYLFKIFSLYPFQTDLVELNSPAWSLRFEMTFYVMFGISLLPYIGRFFLAAWIIMVFWHRYPGFILRYPAGFLFHAIGWHPTIPAQLNLHFFGFFEVYFFAGLAAGFAASRLHLPAKVNWAVLAVSAAGFVGLLSLASWGFSYPAHKLVPENALALGLIIYAVGALELAGALRLPAWGARLGDMSYPLYIFHPMLIFLMLMAFFYHPAWRHYFTPHAMFVGFQLCSLLLVVCITFLIDRPLQRFLRNLPFARRVAG